MLTRIQKIRSPAWQAKCLKGEQIAFETNFIFFFENAYMEDISRKYYLHMYVKMLTHNENESIQVQKSCPFL